MRDTAGMTAKIAAIYRHPVKGFTPEPLDAVDLAEGAYFPCDRIYAVEDGPSGFDPAAPVHISKQKFTVLAHIAEVAQVRTAYDEATGVLAASAPGRAPFAGDLRGEPGRAAFAAWLADFLGEAARGPLKVFEAVAPAHRFMDSRSGFVSIINLASVRDLEARLGRRLDPLRFRANFYVQGWDAWVENDWTGRGLRLGEADLEVLKPIVRCAATHVDPATGERDVEVVKGLFDNYGHMFCGVYASVTRGGAARIGDAAACLAVAAAA